MKFHFVFIPVFTCIILSSCSNKGVGETLSQPQISDVADIATIAGNEQVALYWKDPQPTVFDRISVTYTPGGADPITVPKGVQKLIIKGLENDIEYQFTIRATDANGLSSAGRRISIAPRASVNTTEVLSPTCETGNGYMILKWTNPDSDFFAGVEISQSPGNASIITLLNGESMYMATGLDSATEYQFIIKTVDSTGLRSPGIALRKTSNDTSVRIAQFSNLPSTVTNIRSIDIIIGGQEVSSYRYSLDGAPWSSEIPVSQKISKAELAEGKHHLLVIGKSRNGIWQSIQQPTRHEWTIDTGTIIAVLSGTPATVTNSTSESISVSGQGIHYYRWAIDDADASEPVPISQSITLTGLNDGSYKLSVWGIDSASNEQYYPTVYYWNVDTVADRAVLSNTPAQITNATTAMMTITGATVTAYKYKIDSQSSYSPEKPITEPLYLHSLSQGDHSIHVIARDAAGNWQPESEPSSYSWTVDIIANTAVLNGLPENETNIRSINVSVSGNEILYYRYALDSAIPSVIRNISDSITAQDLADGTHTLSVWGIDAAGNEQTIPTQYTWNINSQSRFASLFNTPTNPTNQQTIEVTVGGNGIVSYRYRIDGGSWSSSSINISVPITVSGLTEGNHTLEVVGIDSLGNQQPYSVPTTFSWRIDLTANSVTLNGLPSLYTRYANHSVSVGGTDIIAYQYRIDSASFSSFISTSVPIAISVPEGTHTLQVIGKDSAGNPSPVVSHTWTHDVTPNTAAISSNPQYTNSTSYSFSISGTGVSEYCFNVDGGTNWSQWKPVNGSLEVVNNLGDGQHTLYVRGRDLAGNEQPTESASVHSWIIDRLPNTAILTNLPTNNTTSRSIAINVSATGVSAGNLAPVTSYAYQINSGPMSAEVLIGSPLCISNLPEGSNLLQVYVKDAAGNWQSSPTAFTWTIDITPPTAALKRITWSPYSAECSIQVSGEGVVSYKWRIKDTDPWSTEQTNMQFILTLGGSAGTVRQVYVIGKDTAGNWQSTPSFLSWIN